MLLLDDEDVVRAMAGGDAVARSIEIIETCFAQIGRGAVAQAPRTQVMYPATARTQAESECSVHCVMGMVPELGAIAARVFTGRRGGEDLTGTRRHWKLLWDFESLDLVCMMADESVHPYLVGAHVGVATNHLARPDARAVGVIGSGKMAYGALRAISAVRDLAAATVYSPDPRHRTRFAREASDDLGIDVRPAESGEVAVADADVVVVATNVAFRGTGPALRCAWLRPGTHVNSIAPQELDEGTCLAASVFPASYDAVMGATPPWEPFRSLAESGRLGHVRADVDLAAVVSGAIPGRTSHDEVTLYLGPSLGPHHAAIAAWIHREARARNLGFEWTPGGAAPSKGGP